MTTEKRAAVKAATVATVSTYTPEFYRLVNTNDGSVWKIDGNDGSWFRAPYPTGGFELTYSEVLDNFAFRRSADGRVDLAHYSEESGCYQTIITDVSVLTVRSILDLTLRHLVMHHM